MVGTGGVKKVTPSHAATSPLLKLHLIQQKAVGRSVVELICCLFLTCKLGLTGREREGRVERERERERELFKRRAGSC